MSLVRINKHPSNSALRLFATFCLLFGGAAGFALWRQGAESAAAFFWAATAVAGGAGLAVPQSVRLVYLGASYAAFPIGFVVSHVILAIVYFLVITPVGLCMRIARRDPLERRFDPENKSYWRPKGPSRPAGDYFRQH